MSTENNDKYESREEVLETVTRKRDLSGANLSGLDLYGDRANRAQDGGRQFK